MVEMRIRCESVTKITGTSYRIRIWAQERRPAMVLRNDLLLAVTKIIGPCVDDWGKTAAKILKLETVNAVEVLLRNGNGLVVYKS